MPSPKIHSTLRQYHRWVGFFLAGIMLVYTISGTLLIFRKTDLLKYDRQVQRQLIPELNAKTLGDELDISNFEVLEQNDSTITFKEGSYDITSGSATIVTKEYPRPLKKLVSLHKATTNSPLYWLNISFALSLLFFVTTAFFMFLPKTKLFKNSLKIASVGFVFAILVVLFGS